LHFAGGGLIVSCASGERGAGPVRDQVGERKAASADVGVKLFLEQARRITDDVVGQQRQRCADAEMLGPVRSAADSYAPQGPTSRTSVAAGENRTEELPDAMMTQKHSQGEDTRPVLSNGIPLDGALASQSKYRLEARAEARRCITR